MPVLRGVHERGEPAEEWALVSLFGFRAGGEKGCHPREIAFLGGEEQIAGGVGGLGLGLGRPFEQGDDIGVAAAAGAVERGLAGLIGEVQIGAGFNQRADGVGLSGPGCDDERGRVGEKLDVFPTGHVRHVRVCAQRLAIGFALPFAVEGALVQIGAGRDEQAGHCDIAAEEGVAEEMCFGRHFGAGVENHPGGLEIARGGGGVDRFAFDARAGGDQHAHDLKDRRIARGDLQRGFGETVPDVGIKSRLDQPAGERLALELHRGQQRDATFAQISAGVDEGEHDVDPFAAGAEGFAKRGFFVSLGKRGIDRESVSEQFFHTGDVVRLDGLDHLLLKSGIGRGNLLRHGATSKKPSMYDRENGGGGIRTHGTLAGSPVFKTSSDAGFGLLFEEYRNHVPVSSENVPLRRRLRGGEVSDCRFCDAAPVPHESAPFEKGDHSPAYWRHPFESRGRRLLSFGLLLNVGDLLHPRQLRGVKIGLPHPRHFRPLRHVERTGRRLF